MNMTRIDEMQNEMQQWFIQNGVTYKNHSISPRIVLEAIDEIRARETGYYKDYFSEHFNDDTPNTFTEWREKTFREVPDHTKP